ncbi:MAG: TIM barrel protein [Planctomycetota bacterium]|nr:TIM barrel protein [Planctomycetota bacterium]
MLLTLNASCLKSLLAPPRKAKPTLALTDLPQFIREDLGLSGMTISTDLLVGADRRRLESIRERADKVGCSCLLLTETEPQNLADPDDSVALAGVERLLRVVQAAQILGCSSASVRLVASDDDKTLALAAQRLRKVIERAERLDLNLLIAPHTGLTSTPERLTELLKKVGGFRIGTFPDFQTAAASKDPVGYLRRLTPYAAVVSASTLKFVEPPPDAPPPSKNKSKAVAKDEDDDELMGGGLDALRDAILGISKKSKAAKDAAPEEEAPAEKPAKGKGKGKSAKAGSPDVGPDDDAEAKGPKGKKPAAPVAKTVEEEEDEGEGEEEDLNEALEADLAELDAELGDEEVFEPAPLHPPYDLDQLVSAVASVGYDGTLAIDYRGEGDAVEGIHNSRRALAAALRAVADQNA